MKAKPVIPAGNAINWYLANYLESPNNALRNDEELLDKGLQSMEELRRELGGQKMTHKQLLDLVKGRGIHAKYYLYRKCAPPYCGACMKPHAPRRP